MTTNSFSVTSNSSSNNGSSGDHSTPDPAISNTILGALGRLSTLSSNKSHPLRFSDSTFPTREILTSNISVIHIPGACRFELGNGGERGIHYIFETFESLLPLPRERTSCLELNEGLNCISRDKPLILCFVGPQVWVEDGTALVFREESDSKENDDLCQKRANILMIMVFGDSVYDEWQLDEVIHVREFLVHLSKSREDDRWIEEILKSDASEAHNDETSALCSQVVKRVQSPDTVVIFQPGFWGYDSWEPSVKRMLSYCVPVVSTGYNLMECEDDEDQLVKFGVKKWIWESEENPWKSTRIRQSSMDEGPDLQENHSWQCWIAE